MIRVDCVRRAIEEDGVRTDSVCQQTHASVHQDNAKKARSCRVVGVVRLNAGIGVADATRFQQPRWLIGVGLPLLVASLWAYWPTLNAIVAQWNRHPDYSHGFLVLPIALFFAWAKRSSFPAEALRPSAIALLLLTAALIGRWIAGRFYMETLDGWSIPVWVAGAVALLLGLRALLWCLPSVVFLWFMVPLPYGAERWLSVPLQSVATQVSTAALRMLNQPAISEGHTIWVGEHVLEVERACSGLRIVVGVSALAFAFVLFSRWEWWQKGLALMAALPVAILANAVRIVGTCFLMANVSGEAARRFSHDLAGWFMIPLAALMFWLLLMFIERLFPLVQDMQPHLGVAESPD